MHAQPANGAAHEMALAGGGEAIAPDCPNTYMAKQTGEFQHQSMQDPASIVKYLEALAGGFRNGRLLFCSGKKELILKPHGLLKFAVKAKNEDGSTKVTLSVSWKDGRRSPAESEPLIIDSSSEPDDE